jgi:CBS domain containing-hemolysin-like protein
MACSTISWTAARPGEKVKIGEFNFEVLEVDEKSIKRVN